MRLGIVVGFAALVVAGCGNTFDPASFVNKLRLLGVKAEPPEVAPGQPTTLAATVGHPGLPMPMVQWDACLLPPPPATGQSFNQDCIGLDGGAALVPFGDGLSVTATMPAIAQSMVGLPDQTNGIYLPVRLRLTAGDQSLVGFYGLRIFVGVPSPEPNHNPEFTGIFTVPTSGPNAHMQTPLDEASPLEVHEKDTVPLRALVKPESEESYPVYDGDPTMPQPHMETEKVRISWFTTAGSFSNEATGVEKPDTTLTLDKHLPAPGTPIDLWVIARDERGGSDALHRTLIFR